MRTTLSLEDDVLMAARNLARARSVSVGDAISELIRRGLEAESTAVEEDGFPVFRVSPDARPITLDDVKQLEDEM